MDNCNPTLLLRCHGVSGSTSAHTRGMANLAPVENKQTKDAETTDKRSSHDKVLISIHPFILYFTHILSRLLILFDILKQYCTVLNFRCFCIKCQRQKHKLVL